VAFMLVHCFWLLEFKFKFEFYCLNPFSKFPKPSSLPTLFLLRFQPNTPSSPAAARFLFFLFTLQAGLAAQQASRASHQPAQPRQPPPVPWVADPWVPLVIPPAAVVTDPDSSAPPPPHRVCPAHASLCVARTPRAGPA
jgi:hypothetical protein